LQEENMQSKRRSFIKKALGASAVVAVGGVKAVARSEEALDSNGVVVGHSPKKEVLYKKTQHWEAYYKRSY
jgi:hypothetical protein